VTREYHAANRSGFAESALTIAVAANKLLLMVENFAADFLLIFSDSLAPPRRFR
jgi:hypothetical protein